jgi:hypothetical protein
VIAKFESAPCSHEEFAARHGLNLGTFRSWLYRLRSEGLVKHEERADAAGFVEIMRGPDQASSRAGCTVRVGNAEVVFGEMPTATYLAEILRELAP